MRTWRETVGVKNKERHGERVGTAAAYKVKKESRLRSFIEDISNKVKNRVKKLAKEKGITLQKRHAGDRQSDGEADEYAQLCDEARKKAVKERNQSKKQAAKDERVPLQQYQEHMTGKAQAKAISKGAAVSGKGGPVKKKEEDEPYTQKGGKKSAPLADGEVKVKRPTSAYFFFCGDRRESFKKEFPSFSMTDSTKKMSEEWNNLDLKKKKKFNDLAAKDKERYETEKAAAPSNNKKQKVDNGGLKRPLSAYFIFLDDRRDAIKKEKPALKHLELVQAMGKEWQDMDAKKKQKYEKQAKELKDKYDIEKAKLGLPTAKRSKPEPSKGKATKKEEDEGDEEEGEEEEEEEEAE